MPWKTQEQEGEKGATEVDILIEEVIPEGGETEEAKEVEVAATDASEAAQAETTEEDTAAAATFGAEASLNS